MAGRAPPGQPSSAERQVPAFHTRARTKLAPPPCRTPPGQYTGIFQACPETRDPSRFRCHLLTFDTSSAVHLRSPSWLTPAALLVRLFRIAHHLGSCPTQHTAVWSLPLRG